MGEVWQRRVIYMGKNYRDMTDEEKERHKENVKRYDTNNAEKQAERRRISSRRYYGDNKDACLNRHKEWCNVNGDYIRQKQKDLKRDRKLQAINYLGGACVDCGGTFHPAIFEFHHANPVDKIRELSKLLHCSWDKLTVELDKCVLLCANCHRLRHHTWGVETDASESDI